jgi:predicted metal-dependent hydrolase
MKLLRFGFVFGLTVQIIISMLGDRATYRPGTVRRSWRRVRSSPLLKRSLWERLKDYDRPDFHPDDHDTIELVETWRQTLFGPEGSLVDKLVGAAA